MSVKLISGIVKPFIKLLDNLTLIADLGARLWVGTTFFYSGLIKLQGWESTKLLFAHEYHVPLLNPTIAAVLGTAAELILPILVMIGLGGRFIIFLFFMLNITAVVSYPHLWTEEGQLGLDQHIVWGLLLALLMTHGSGKLSIDYLLRRRYGKFL